jgi:hypothetical protein
MKLSGQTIEEMIPESEESDEEFLAFTQPGFRTKNIYSSSDEYEHTIPSRC